MRKGAVDLGRSECITLGRTVGALLMGFKHTNKKGLLKVEEAAIAQLWAARLSGLEICPKLSAG